LSDIATAKSATVGKQKKADEKTVIGELAESERPWQRIANDGERTKDSSRDSLPASQPLSSRIEKFLNVFGSGSRQTLAERKCE